jgi:hypothetical protein
MQAPGNAAFLLRRASPAKALRIVRLDRRPVFIVGCGRSGTTLVLAMLGAHPDIVAVPGETGAFLQKESPPKRVIWERLARLDIPEPAARWAEKTPRHVHHIARILKHYGPGVRILNLVRDGRDVVTSIHPSAPDRPWVAPSRWVTDVSAGMRWEAHPQVMTVKYEQLATETEDTVRAICEFLEEPYAPEMLRFPPFARSHGRVVEFPVSRASIGRWRTDDPYGAAAALLEEPGAVDLLKRFGYQ